MVTILVSGVSGIVGYGCVKTIKKQSNYKVIGIAAYDSIVARKLCDEFYIAPFTSEKRYISWLKDFIKQNNINVLIPGIECDVYEWNRHRTELESLGIKLILNNEELIQNCYNKYSFYEMMKDLHPNIMITTMLDEGFENDVKKLSLPFVLKAQVGYGAKGFKIINSKKDYIDYKNSHNEDFICQRYINGKEYTVGAFFNNDSELLYCISMERELSAMGYTQNAVVINNSKFEDLVRKIGKSVKAQGVTNFQFIENSEAIYLLEINPRVSSSTSIREMFGYNECLLAIEYAMEGKVFNEPIIRKGRASRYIEDVVEYDSDNF